MLPPRAQMGVYSDDDQTYICKKLKIKETGAIFFLLKNAPSEKIIGEQSWATQRTKSNPTRVKKFQQQRGR